MKKQKSLKKVDVEFWKEYNKIISECKSMCEDRQASYVGEENNSITEYWIHGEDDLFYEINKKNKRLRGLLKFEIKNGKDKVQKTADSITDTLIDNINYNAFLLAFRRINGK